jgi:Glycosyl hydrolase family 47
MRSLANLLVALVAFIVRSSSEVVVEEIYRYREGVRQAFMHSFVGYLTHAYPYDELMPLSCMPRKFDNRTRGDLDDVLGGYMLTLVESLSVLLTFREFDLFVDALELLKPITFDRDLDVSVWAAYYQHIN